MSRADEDNKVVKCYLVIKEWLPTAGERLRERYAFVRETPGVVWTLPEVRYGLFVIAVLVALTSVSWVFGLLKTDVEPIPRATTADFHVMCTNESCSKQFVIHERIKFDDFPSPCPHCKQQTGARALRCNSTSCKGQRVPTEIRDKAYYCQICKERIRRK